MDNEKITNEIQASLEQGKTKETIYQELLQQGVTIETIEKIFHAIQNKPKKEEVAKKNNICNNHCRDTIYRCRNFSIHCRKLENHIKGRKGWDYFNNHSHNIQHQMVLKRQT